MSRFVSSDGDFIDHDRCPVVVDLAEQVLRPSLADAQESPDNDGLTFSCVCKLHDGGPCFKAFEESYILSIRDQFSSLTREEFDIAILAKLECGIHVEHHTRKSKKAEQSERRSSRTDYFLHGHRVCRDFFKFIHHLSQSKLDSLIKHYKENGVQARVHKLTNKQPKNAYSFEDRKRVVEFIVNYTDIHGIELPGRTPKHWITNGKLLPTNCTKKSVFIEYQKASTALLLEPGHIVGERTFFDLWQRLLPFVRTMPPASDLCSTCEQGTIALRRSANKSDEQKTTVVRQLEEHQTAVKKERDYYKDMCRNIKTAVESGDKTRNHVSFDFAQQVHYPYSPRQQGPIYFKTPRKCGVFGVNTEALGQQINYLIDERHTTGKGANTIISYLHYHLKHYTIGEIILFLSADNCTGQNKNNAMMWYLLWRVMTEQHEEITLSFLIAGHTKFSPDGGFGLFKRKFKQSEIHCLKDIVEAVESSSKMNNAVLIGQENSDESHVPTYDWVSHFAPVFHKLKAVKSYHHFRFTKSGDVFCKKYVDSEEVKQSIFKNGAVLPTELPPVIKSPGLPAQRQWYLFEQIREFVSEPFQDTVTPKPLMPKPGKGAQSDAESDGDDDLPELTATTPSVPSKRPAGTVIQDQAPRGRGRGRGRGAKQTRFEWKQTRFE